MKPITIFSHFGVPFCDVVSTSHYIESNGRMSDEQIIGKRIGRKRSCPIEEFACWDWGKHEKAVRIAGVLADTRTEHPPITKSQNPVIPTPITSLRELPLYQPDRVIIFKTFKPFYKIHCNT
jgi:hypothetical protein